MTDIFLYQGSANPNDVRLRDPAHVSLSFTVPAATATVASVAPALRLSYASPVQTASAASVVPALRLRYATPVETAAGASVAPALRSSYTTPASRATDASVAPTLRSSFAVPAASASDAAVAPSIRASFGTSAGSGSASGSAPGFTLTFSVPAGVAAVAGVAPGLKTAVGVPTEAASVSASARLAVTFGAPTMTATGETVGFAPTYRVRLAAPAMSASAALVVPQFSSSSEQGFFAVGQAYPLPFVFEDQMVPLVLSARAAEVEADAVAPQLEVRFAVATASASLSAPAPALRIAQRVEALSAELKPGAVRLTVRYPAIASTSTTDTGATGYDVKFTVGTHATTTLALPPQLLVSDPGLSEMSLEEELMLLTVDLPVLA